MRFLFENLNVPELSFCDRKPSFCDTPISKLPGYPKRQPFVCDFRPITDILENLKS